MARSLLLWAGTLAVVGVLMLSGVTSAMGRNGPASAATAAPTHLVGASRPTEASASDAREQTILRELRNSGIPPSDIHLPDLSVPRPYAGETVAPTYAVAPAPMGVSDLGLTNVSGKLVGSVLDTASVEGTVTFTNALSANVDGDGPDMFGVQLNSVVTGVTVFGNSSDEFWMQNFVSYTPSSGQLVFGDNVWNFSNFAAYISPNVFYAHGQNGTLYAPVYYYAVGPTFTIHYPFTITFYENSTVLFQRPAVYFNYTVSNSTMSVSGSYDYVVFNATAAHHIRHRFPAGRFQINGLQVDPVGLPNDLELSVLGNDDGDTTTFYAMNANLSIATWDAATRTYVPVRSAVDAGSETGETSDGIAVSFVGSTPVAHLSLGPSFIYGLWGMSSNSGARKVVQKLHPANTFILVNPGTTQNESEAQWVPGSPTGTTTFYVPNGGPYWIEYELSERTPGHVILTGAPNSTTVLSFTGKSDRALGVYTPLIAFGNGELPTISSSGSGTLASPYVIDHNEPGPIDPVFAAYNEYQWPVFPGLLLVGTTDYVTVIAPPFNVTYPSWLSTSVQELGQPATNNLQLWFWNVSNVRLLGGTITGWLSAFLVGFPEGSVIFWNSSNNLVADVTFLDQGDALDLFGGTSNTIWGNSFLDTATTASNSSNVLNSGNSTEAINESESGDLIYNNYIDVPVPAITPTYNPLSCQIICEPAVYIDTWNVSRQPATEVNVVEGIALSGNILGYAWQGGNFWSNYGNQSNPYGVLPYNDSGLITVGGDYLPLAPPIYEVTFVEHGLRPGTLWSVTLNGITFNSTGRRIAFWDPNGTYAYSAEVLSGHPVPAIRGEVTVRGASIEVLVRFP